MVRVVASAQKKNQGLNSFSELPTTIATEIATHTLIVIGETCSLDALMKNTRKKALHTQTARVATNGYFLATFKRWYESFNYQDYHLDKDILVKNNKVYSPDTCCLVPPEINMLFTKRQNDRGKQPIGVCYIKRSGKYSATIHKLRNVHLGFFDTPEEAFQAYKSAKETYVKELATKYFQEGKITQRVYQALMEYQVEITD